MRTYTFLLCSVFVLLSSTQLTAFSLFRRRPQPAKVVAEKKQWVPWWRRRWVQRDNAARKIQAAGRKFLARRRIEKARSKIARVLQPAFRRREKQRQALEQEWDVL